jgi:hypothetical protein
MSVSINKEKIGNIALFLAIAAVPIPFIISIAIPSTKDFLWINGPILIWILEFVAFILGVVSRKTLFGKISIFLSIAISAALLTYSLPAKRR